MFRMPEMIIVNNFMFCANHGSEYCPYCTCDHRPTNNIQIEDGLVAKFPEDCFDVSSFCALGHTIFHSAPPASVEHFTKQERTPINAYEYGAIQDGNTESYKCRTHQEVDCKKCFDWLEVVSEEVKAQ
jgi:hypothetical protein